MGGKLEPALVRAFRPGRGRRERVVAIGSWEPLGGA